LEKLVAVLAGRLERVWGLVAGAETDPVVPVLVLETVIQLREVSLQACRCHLRRGICEIHR